MTTTTSEFAPAEDTSAGPDRRKLIIAGGVAAALVLGYGGFSLLSGGSSNDLALGVPPAAVPRTPVKTLVKVPAKAKPKSVVPAASTVKLGRDPFLALYTVPVVAAPSSTTPTTTTPGTPSAPGAVAPPAGTGSSPGSPAAPAAPSSAPYALTLKSIGTSGEVKTFTFNVDGQSKTVVPAQKFGKYGELVVLAYVKNAKGDPIGALIQVGDDDPVGIKVGEKLTVL